MREVILEAAPSDSSRLLTAVFVILWVGLIVVSLDIVIQVFGPANSTVLGADLAAGFAIIGLMTIVYYRLFIPHRVMLEQDEDLW